MSVARAPAAMLVVFALLAAIAGCGSDGDGVPASATAAPASATAPAPRPPAKPVSGPTLVAAGDIACAPGEPRTAITCHHADTAALAARLDPDVVATLGDTQYEAGSSADFAGSYAPTWGRLKARTRPAVGNHEYGTPDAAGYFGYFGRRAGTAPLGWYSYALGSWHVVVLNGNCGIVGCSAGSPQQRWLRADLAAHPARCTLAYWHQPRFSSGLHGSDEAVAPLWRTLQRAGAEVVLSGHDHDYERFAPQTADGRADPRHGIVQFVSGGGGKSHYPFVAVQPNSRARASTFGVLQLTLGRERWAWRFVGEAGERFRDVGATRCH